jgi:hypothetical protein
MTGPRAGIFGISNHHANKERIMKVKTRHRKTWKWKQRADSSPVAKGRRKKIHGKRNPRKHKHLGGKGL